VAAAQGVTTTSEGVMPAGRFFRYVFAAALCLSLMGCSKEGPTGPVGASGPAGPQGEPGSATRVVYNGTVTAAAAEAGQWIPLPELQLSNFPLVAVYISDATDAWIQCNLTIYDPPSQTYLSFEMAVIQDGGITLYSNMQGQEYRIVIVK
jgi:hypothetical protein